MRSALPGRHWFVPRVTLSEEPPRFLGVSPVLSRLLSQRGIRSQDQADAFLSPEKGALTAATLLPDIDKAAERILCALERRERIAVFGDYDADGVCATALLVSALRKHGGDVFYIIPSRHAEGYGLSATAVEAIANQAALLITVDNGISAHAEARLCRERGLDLIITDHHMPSDELPDALAIVNPKRRDADPASYDGLCGAGVAGRLVERLFGPEALDEVMDLVALATVADIVPLLGDNRLLVARGLERINSEQRRSGMEALVRQAGHAAGQELTAGDIAYKLAPRINAGGRLAGGGDAVGMLLHPSVEEAAALAAKLEDVNAQRRSLEARMFDEACERVDGGEADLARERCIVLSKADWNVGVVGIVASRLVERYGVPAFLFGLDAEGGMATGSARGVPGVHLFDLLRRHERLLARYGGHELAAGMTLEASKLPDLRSGLNDALRELDSDVFLPKSAYDAELSLEDVTLELCAEIERMQPFGAGNPKPVFLSRGIKATHVRKVGADGSHVQLTFEGNRAPQGVAFSAGDRTAELNMRFDAIVQASRKEWRGQVKAQVVLREFTCSAKASLEALKADNEDVLRAFLRSLAYNACILPKEGGPPSSGDDLRRLLSALMRDPRGTVFLCYCVSTAERLVDRMSRDGAAHRISVFTGAPPYDPRALGCVVVGPDPASEGYAPYRRAVWLDGLPTDGLSSILPVREQTVVNPGARLARMAGEMLPDIAQIRAVYRACKCEAAAGETLARTLSRAAGVETGKVLASLEALAACGLIDPVEKSAQSVNMLPPKACDPSSSRVIENLRQLAGNAEKLN